MSKHDANLQQLQGWMQAVLMHPGGVVAGMLSDEARRHLEIEPEGIDSVINPSRQQSSIERLEIYSRAYYARLVECLRSEFPMLTTALGEDVFDQFAAGYLQDHPSRSYTLTRLGAGLADYLAATQPAGDENAWLGFLVELARLEWCFNEVFDGPGPEGHPPMSPETLHGISGSQWSACRLTPVAGLRLTNFAYPVHEMFHALRRGERPDPPAARLTHLVIWRRDYIVRHDELSGLQIPLLAALVAGQNVGEAIEQAAVETDDLTPLAQSLEGWFRKWIQQGLFAGVER